MVIIPQPATTKATGAQVAVPGLSSVLGANATELERYAARLIDSALCVSTPARVVLGTPQTNPEIAQAMVAPLEGVENADQGYVLRVSGEGVTIAAMTPVGVLYGVQTLLQLAEKDGDSVVLPECTVVDWPKLRYRGIFAESRWCSELMTLDDWKSAIDTLAGLKMNVLNIGIANCWMIQYEGKRSEFLLVPIEGHPELQAPQSVEYYSAQRGEYVRDEYLPRMFEEDFFGEVVAYGASRGVTVYPHFNTPGHNTLIPRKIPEISSKDESGNPTGFGFCLSNPKTYEVMFGILDEIAERYLLPNGVRFFHLGLDEVWPILGMDEDEPTRVVSPFCRCEECAKREWYDQFVDYAVALCKHLVDRGFETIGMWHDSFVRGGRMNEELADRLRREGLEDKVAIHWWRYGGFFDTLHPELGLRNWVVPMTGYYYWTPLQDHFQNIHLAAMRGAEENAEGAESYTVYYPAYYHNYACLAEFSWNPTGTGDVDAFRGRYRQFLFGDSPEGIEALMHFDFITGPMRATNWSIYHYSYAYGLDRHASFVRSNYPQAIIEQLWDNPGGVLHNLGMICEHARAARRIFERESLWRRDPAGLSSAYSAEMARTAASAHLFLRLAQAVRAYRDMRREGEADATGLKNAVAELSKALEEMGSAILAVETGLPHYMRPSLIRELTMQRRFGWALKEELESVVGAVESGHVTALPELECMKTHEIRWVGKAHRGDSD